MLVNLHCRFVYNEQRQRKRIVEMSETENVDL